MILKDWSAAWKLYTETRPRPPKARSKSELFRKARSYWRIWLLLMGLIVSAVFMGVGVWTESPAMAIGGFSFAILIVWLIRYASTKALATEFARCYATHGLAQYPLSTRGRYVHYALFLEKLVEQKYSQDDVKKLLRFADIVKPPEQSSFQLSQYPSMIYLLGVCTPLIVNLLTNSPAWKRAPALFLTLILQAIGLGFAVIPSWHLYVSRPKDEHLTLQRFLQWAEHDIGEAQSLKDQQRRMELPVSNGQYR